MTKPQAVAAPLSPSQLIGERLKELRRLRGWSAKQLAERCTERGAAHLTAYVIANIETKRRVVSSDDLLALAYACDVSPVYLLTPPDDAATLSVTESVDAPDRHALLRWLRGDGPMPGMDEDFYATHGGAKASVSDVDYGRELLLSGSKRLISQYDARAEEFLRTTRAQVRGVIGDLRQAVSHAVEPADIIQFLDDVEADLTAPGPETPAQPGTP